MCIFKSKKKEEKRNPHKITSFNRAQNDATKDLKLMLEILRNFSR